MVALEILVSYILLWGFIETICFTALLVILYLSGSGNLVRDEEGKFKKKKKIQIRVYLLYVLLLSLLTGLPILANIFFVVEEGITLDIVEIFTLTYGIFLFANVWDLILIDYFLVVKNVFRLKNLPETLYYTSFRPHLVGFFRGLVFGLFFSLISSGITYLVIG
ncbi:MAG: hypothetical protein ACFFFG_16880 [Candidatus Thorarchaeota archaeon]